MTKLFKKTDIKELDTNLPYIIENAKIRKIENDPERLQIYIKTIKLIKNYILKNRRIVYGGYAMNYLLIKTGHQGIYDPRFSMADIEFYSNNPIQDVKNICDILHNNGIKEVKGTEAQHKDTFKIYADFNDICDISYMPTFILNNLEYEIFQGLRLVTPTWLSIDYFRQFNDILGSSLHRIEKQFKRFKTFNLHRPLIHYNSFDLRLHNQKIEEIDKKLETYILKEILSDINTNLLVGYKAFNIFASKTGNKKLKVPYYEIITINIFDTSKKIKKDLKNKYKLTTKEYYPFFQFLDRGIEFYNDGKLFLSIRENNRKCIPYLEDEIEHQNKKYKIRYGTFTFNLMINLMKYYEQKMVTVIPQGLNRLENFNGGEKVNFNSYTDKELKSLYQNSYLFDQAKRDNLFQFESFLFYIARTFDIDYSQINKLKILDDKSSDYQYFSFIRSHAKSKTTLLSSKKLSKKVINIKDMIQESGYTKKDISSFNRIMDIGTESKEYLDLSKKVFNNKKVIGLNIRDGFNHYNIQDMSQLKDVKDFYYYDGKNIPFKDKFDLISLTSVIHHVKPDILPFLIKEIARVSSGLVFIKDVDLDSIFRKNTFILQHYVFEGVFGNKGSSYMNDKIKFETVDKLMLKNGFEIINKKEFNNFNGTYHALYRKIDGSSLKNKRLPELERIWIFNELIEISKKYLKKNNKTLADNTIFKFFNDEKCLGEIIDEMRESREKMLKKIRKKRFMRMEYIYSEDGLEKNTFPSDPKRHNFDNISGNKIRNPKDKILK